MKRFLLTAAAALAAIFLVATPAVAAAPEWIPEEKPSTSNYLVSSTLPEAARNAIEGALESAEVASYKKIYLYATALPEGVNIQTAARGTAKAWELTQGSDALVFYDGQQQKVFIWPSTEDNVALTASLGDSLSPDLFSASVADIYDSDNFGSGDSSFSDILLMVVIGGIVVVLLFYFVGLLFY